MMTPISNWTNTFGVKCRHIWNKMENTHTSKCSRPTNPLIRKKRISKNWSLYISQLYCLLIQSNWIQNIVHRGSEEMYHHKSFRLFYCTWADQPARAHIPKRFRFSWQYFTRWIKKVSRVPMGVFHVHGAITGLRKLPMEMPTTST